MRIQKPVREVFAFTIDPACTPQWIEKIEEEETNEWPPALGSIYKNKTKSGKLSEYVVTDFTKDHSFELTSRDGNYHVRYAYGEIKPDVTALEYHNG